MPDPGNDPHGIIAGTLRAARWVGMILAAVITAIIITAFI